MIAAYRWILDKLKERKTTVVLGIVFFVAVLVAAFFIFAPGKTPKEFYFEAESKYFLKYADDIKKTYREFYQAQEPYMNGRHKRRSELTLKIETESEKTFGLENARSIFDLVERCKIVIDSNNNPAGEKSVSNVSLLLEKAPLIDAQFFTEGKQLGFTIPVFAPDMYFKLDTGRIDEVYDRFEIPVRPEDLPGKTAIAKTLIFDDLEFDNTIREYGRFISGFIEEKDVRFEKNLTLVIGGKKIKGREVAVTIGSEKAGKFIQELAGKIATDETFLKLTYGNYAGLTEIINKTGLFDTLSLLEENGRLNLNEHIKPLLRLFSTRNDMDGLKEQIKSRAGKYEYPEGLKMVLTIDSRGNILDRRVSIPYIKPGEKTQNKLEIHMAPKNTDSCSFNNISMGFDITKIDTDGRVRKETASIDTMFNAINKDKDGQSKIEFNYEKLLGADIEFAVLLKADIEKNTDAASRENYISRYDVEFKGKDVNLTDRISGEVRTAMWKNNKRKTSNTDTGITANIDMPSFDIKDTVLELHIAREDRFDIEDFSLPEIAEMEMIDLNNIAYEELAKVKARIMASFGTFYLNNKPIFDAVMK